MKKIIIIIYAVVAVATGLCALVLKDYLNITVFSLFPVGVMLVHIILGLLAKNNVIHFRRGRFYVFSVDDFKYSKNSHGKGEFQSVESNRRDTDKKTQNIIGYGFIIVGALALPFIFFFPIEAKCGCIGLLLIPVIVGRVVDVYATAMKKKADIAMAKARSEQHQRELEEQKKREEMGYWK